MIRTTITKIKRVCAIALVPRILRGDVRCTPGKFEKLTIDVYRNKSSKSGTPEDEEYEKAKKIIELTFPTKPLDSESYPYHIVHEGRDNFNVPLENQEDRCEKCKRIIAEVFGTEPEVVNKEVNPVEQNPVADIPIEPITLATTVKENDEKLLQKIENIKEPELVVAESPQVEGFNTPPKVLGDKEDIQVVDNTLHATPIKNEEDNIKDPELVIDSHKIEGPPNVFTDNIINISKNSSIGNKNNGTSPDSDIVLDEIAKRCMNTPSNQIDDRLIKEMEKLGVPPTSQKVDQGTPLMENEMIQLEIIKKPRKPSEKTEIDFETRVFEKDPVDCGEKNKLHPSFAPSPMFCERNIAAEEVEYVPFKSERSTHHKDPVLSINEVPIRTVEVAKEGMENHEANIKKETENIKMFTLDPMQVSKQAKLDALGEDKPEINEVKQLTAPKEKEKPEEEIEKGVNQKVVEGSIKIDPKQALLDPYDKGSVIYDAEDYELDYNKFSLIDAVKKFYEEHPLPEALKEQIDLERSALFNTVLDTKQAIKDNPEPVQDESQPVAKEQNTQSYIQAEIFLDPLVVDSEAEHQQSMEKVSAALGPLPKLKPDSEVSLSELLKRIRERNRIQYCKDFELRAEATQVDPTVGKCGKKPPPCPPPAPVCPPPNPCPPPPPPCPPPPPPCPKPCKPACPPPCPPKKCDPCAKCESVDCNFKDAIAIMLHVAPIPSISQTFSAFVNSSEDQANTVFYHNKACLTEDIIVRLQTIGKILLTMYLQNAPTTDLEGRVHARDYEPWVPIPSWPIPKKEKKRKLVCPKEGCKVSPPPRLVHDPPCHEKPCTGFPRRHFTIVDLFALHLGEKKVYDIGEF